MNEYKKGQWDVCCDVCGRIIKSGKARKRWDGFIVCPEDYEQRHPMDFIKVPKETSMKVPFSRPEPADQFVTVNYIDTGDSPYCSPTSRGGADYATADCALADQPSLGL